MSGPQWIASLLALLLVAGSIPIHARELAPEDQKMLEQFKRQLLDLEPGEAPYLKNVNPEELFVVGGSLVCPVSSELVVNVTSSVLARARIKSKTFDRDPKPGEVWLSVWLTCNMDARMPVYWVEVDFLTWANEFLGNVILLGGSSWAGILEEDDIASVLVDAVNPVLEQYVRTNFF